VYQSTVDKCVRLAFSAEISVGRAACRLIAHAGDRPAPPIYNRLSVVVDNALEREDAKQARLLFVERSAQGVVGLLEGSDTLQQEVRSRIAPVPA
jgi:hypothetical protein